MSGRTSLLRLSILGIATWASLTLFAQPATAENSPWSIEGRLGSSTLDAAFGISQAKVFDDDDSAFSFEVGYRFNQYLRIQAGYHDLGEFKTTGTPCGEGQNCIERLAALAPDLSLGQIELCALEGGCIFVEAPLSTEVTGWSLSLLPHWPFSERFSAFGRLGVLDVEADVRVAGGGFGNDVIERFSDQALFSGLGLRATWSAGFELALEHQWVDLDTRSLGLAAGWRF